MHHPACAPALGQNNKICSPCMKTTNKMSTMSLEDRISNFVDDILKVEAVEEAFNLYIVHRPHLEAAKLEQRAGDWCDILSECATNNTGGPDQTDQALKFFVASIANPNRDHKFQENVKEDVLLHLLELAVSKKVVGARQVCDALLNSEHLKPERSEFWIATFRLIRNVIGGVDYKGVREIMKNSIEKVKVFPKDSTPAMEKQVNVVRQLLEYIFDRNAALLPGYFIVNEILKDFPDKPLWPHWTISPLMSDFLNSFRPTAQMVSSTLKHKMRPIVEQTGKAHQISSWKVEPLSLKFILKSNMTYDRILPYAKEIVQPQKELLTYILKQLYSKELVNSVMGVQKPRKDSPVNHYPLLEDSLVHLFIKSMDEAEEAFKQSAEPEKYFPDSNMSLLWWNLSSELIFFLLFQFLTFPTFVENIHQNLVERSHLSMKEGRDFLMWALLQFISGSIGKNTATDFYPVLKLFSLYDEKEPLPVPKGRNAVRKLSAAAIYIHLQRKMAIQNGDSGKEVKTNYLPFALPVALRKHYEYLQGLAVESENNFDMANSLENDFKVVIICNTFSTANDYYSKVILIKLINIIQGANIENQSINVTVDPVPIPGSNNLKACGAIVPLSMELLDHMSVHAKMSLTHSISSHMQMQIQVKPFSLNLAPALIETFCRLLVFSEIESLGIKGLLNHLLPLIFKTGNWAAFNALLEMFSYRLHYVQATFRLSLMSHLQMHVIGGVHNHILKHPQLNIAVESTFLKLITGLSNAEITTPRNTQNVPPGQQKPSNVMYGDSEELNRVVILSLARAIHIHGHEQQSTGWFKEILQNIMNKTPHSWPSHTLADFPPILKDFYVEHQVPRENKNSLMQQVEDEYKTWTSMPDDANKIQHFSGAGGNTLFLCVLWKVLLDTDQITSIAYKVLERIGPKQLTAHLRSFCDVLVLEFSKSGGAGHVNKCIDAMNNLIWKYNIIALDRIILCMALRTNEGNDAQVCFFIIQLLLLKPQEFRNRVSELVKNMSPEHWMTNEFYTNHLEFHNKFPEKFTFEDQQQSYSSDPTNASLPVYFGNVCLRFIPVFDIVVHRFLELPPVSKSLETLMDHIGVLYKFHDRPITYLYNTLHYYEHRIRDRHSLKKKLVSSIVGSLKDVRPDGWCLTNDYQRLLENDTKDDAVWNPGLDYYVRLVGRLVRTIQGKHPFPLMDWRFNEFPNEGAHALYATCVELMGLPISDPANVGSMLVDLILEANHLISAQELPDWINAIGLILSYLPDVYLEGLKKRLVSALTSPPLSNWNLPQNPFDVFNFNYVHSTSGSTSSSRLSRLMAVAHAFYHHAGFNQIQQLPELVRDKFLPIVKTEEQLLFIYHLAGPFLQRLHTERYTRPLIDMTVHFYRILGKVDKEVTHLKYMDPVCDILYHVKYQFIGDAVRSDAEKIVKDLRPALQLRLRFVSPSITVGSNNGK